MGWDLGACASIANMTHPHHHVAHAVGDTVAMQSALERYEEVDYTFSGSREGKLLKARTSFTLVPLQASGALLEPTSLLVLVRSCSVARVGAASCPA